MHEMDVVKPLHLHLSTRMRGALKASTMGDIYFWLVKALVIGIIEVQTRLSTSCRKATFLST